jgi:phosphoribosylamine-glycine ligase
VALLPGASDAAIRENIRSLRGQGYSEVDAVARANAYADGSDETDGEEDAVGSDVAADDSTSSARQFVVVTKDYSGLGWAKKLQEEGETVTLAVQNPEDKPDHKKQFDQVATGWVEKVELSTAVNTLQSDNTYWIFSENCFVEEAEKLRKAGQKVFGTSTLSDRMEHDREYAVDIAEQSGLQSPPTHPFTTRQEGLAFLEENTDKAYVFKPDDSKGTNYSTFVPIRKKDVDANRETYEYLSHMKSEPGSYILQERIPLEEGTEVCVEAWMYEGEPFVAFMGLEVKRKNTYDLGEMAGCGGDFNQMIPLDCPLVKQTIGLMFPFYKDEAYTGFADVNVIFRGKQPYFLEVCNRFGYNSHPNLFINLAKEGFGVLLADFIDGHIDGMSNRFKSGVGSSLTLFLDHPRVGLPVHVDEKYAAHFYPFEGYKDSDSDTLILAGYSEEIGIFLEYADTIEAAAKKCLDEIIFEEAVSVPDLHYRTDVGGEDYYNSPLTRLKRLKKLGLL